MSTISAIMFAKRRSEVDKERFNQAASKHMLNVQKRLREINSIDKEKS